MKIAKLMEASRKTVRINGEWDGQTFWFDTVTSGMSAAFLQKLKDSETHPTKLAEALSEVIADWEGGDEQPPTAEYLEGLPIEFLSFLVDRIAEVWQGNASSPGKSANGSAVSAK